MNIFSKMATMAGLILSGYKAAKELDKIPDIAGSAQSREQWLAAAPQFANSARLLSDLADKVGKAEKLDPMSKPGDRPAERVMLGADAMRLMSVYSMQTAGEEVSHDLAEMLADKVLGGWEKFRTSAMRAVREGVAEEKGPALLLKISNLFVLRSIDALGVAARMKAKSHSEKGALDPSAYADLVARFKTGQADEDAALTAMARQKLAKAIAQASKEDNGVSESELSSVAMGALLRIKAVSEAKSACQLAQIHFFAGKRDEALAALVAVNVPLVPENVAAQRETWNSEIKGMRGNDPVFCAWAATAFLDSRLAHAVQADSASPSASSPKI